MDLKSKVFSVLTFTLLVITVFSCHSQPKTKSTKITEEITTKDKSIINEQGITLEERILPPDGFERISISENSYANYLRTIRLKPSGSKVKYFDGSTKQPDGVYMAVVDLEIGKRDLHQCADAIMRLKAEYHWNQAEYDKIHFNFTNGFRVDYSEWMKGRRMVVKGNKTHWNNRNQASNTYEDFWNYMELIFNYAGTYSLSKELQKVDYKQMKIGDVLIIGGFPGHAVVVMDMAKNSEGQQLFLMAQSYMPAQQLQILINGYDQDKSPWYDLNSEEPISTPEWNFWRSNLMRFRD